MSGSRPAGGCDGAGKIGAAPARSPARRDRAAGGCRALQRLFGRSPRAGRYPRRSAPVRHRQPQSEIRRGRHAISMRWCRTDQALQGGIHRAGRFLIALPRRRPPPARTSEQAACAARSLNAVDDRAAPRTTSSIGRTAHGRHRRRGRSPGSGRPRRPHQTVIRPVAIATPQAPGATWVMNSVVVNFRDVPALLADQRRDVSGRTAAVDPVAGGRLAPSWQRHIARVRAVSAAKENTARPTRAMKAPRHQRACRSWMAPCRSGSRWAAAASTPWRNVSPGPAPG